MPVIQNQPVRLVTVYLPDTGCEELDIAELRLIARARARGFFEMIANRRPHSAEVPSGTGFISRFLVAPEHADHFLEDVGELCARFPVSTAPEAAG